jgi:hypothetical protein
VRMRIVPIEKNTLPLQVHNIRVQGNLGKVLDIPDKSAR